MNREEIVASLAAFPERLEEVMAAIDGGAARTRPPSGEWSVIELVCHLRDYAEIFNSRLSRALREDNPSVRSYDNEEMAAAREYPTQDLAKVIAASEHIHADMVGVAARMSPADWERTMVHPAWGRTTIEWILNRCAEHELEHLDDIRRIRDGGSGQ